MLLSTTTACASGGTSRPSAERELVVATTAPAPSLDPTNTLAASGAEISLHVFDALKTYDENYDLMPNPAKSWSVSDDGLTYWFELVAGIRFHDGTTMTADDVVASIDRAVKIGVSNATLKPIIDSVRAESGRAVAVRLKKRFTALSAVLANPLSPVVVMPAKYARKHVPLKPPELIGTGPFKITAWKPDRYTLLTKFDGYTPHRTTESPPASVATERRRYTASGGHRSPKRRPASRGCVARSSTSRRACRRPRTSR